ncbi:MAG: glycosyltransferase family 4 protein [Firmicutes bacterium]|nr:glycosyltransferase family 4 protein [Bacillota bacterium]
MKILTLSWEYPPRIVGGIARVVYDLTQEMSQKGIDNYILTCGEEGLRKQESRKNLNIYRVNPYNIEGYDFIQWVYHLNMAMVEKAVQLYMEGIRFDIIHVHDWITAFCGRTLKGIFKIPLVSTIHATEFGRNSGLHNDMQKYISNIEWWLTYESNRVIVNSRFMENQLTGFFQLQKDKISIVHNGVRVEDFASNDPSQQFRGKYAAENEKIIFHIGRIVQEKGLQVLIDAIPLLLKDFQAFKVVIAGKGPFLDTIKKHAAELGIEDKIYFTGFIDDATRNMLFRASDAAVFPSLYEPFGIVALEGMAARIPVVVSDTGGLRETIEQEKDGLKFSSGSSKDLAAKLLYVLKNPEQSKKMAENGYKKVKNSYSWSDISDRVICIYNEVLNNTNNPLVINLQKGWLNEGHHYGRG